MAMTGQIGAMRENGAGPRYMLLQSTIRAAIDEGRLRPQDALPSERDLGDQYEVSRVTVRRAIEGLVDEGLLVRRRGAGTFVAGPVEPGPKPRVEKSFSMLSSFSEDMIARGRVPSSNWVSRTTGAVTPEEAMSLGLSPGSPVYRFHRIRYADGATMAIELSTIAGFCLSSLEAVDDSLYEALAAAGHRPVRALQRLRALAFGEELATPLGVPVGHAGLFIERRSFLADGRAAEYTQSYYRGDAYDLVAELSDL